MLENLNEVRNETAIWMYGYEMPHKSTGNISTKKYADITNFNRRERSYLNIDAFFLFALYEI
ncbi:MAG: hypothetical protein COB98_08665 [Flavobacteriaceae bacterium]|nr:MAG: hypothetical protein COB98_08665 [Flavobacteriaceae bacterium]